LPMPVDRHDIALEGVEDGEIALEADLGGADLRNDRIGVDRRAPEAALRSFQAQELTVENNSRFHCQYPCGISKSSKRARRYVARKDPAIATQVDCSIPANHPRLIASPRDFQRGRNAAMSCA